SAVSSTRNPVSSAAFVAFLVATGSGMSVPKPSAGMRLPLLRGNFVSRRPSGFDMVLILLFRPFSLVTAQLLLFKSDMPSYKHRPVNIETELMIVRDVAKLLRIGGPYNIVRAHLSRLLNEQSDAPAPLVELYNWTESAASRDPTLENSRDTLFELITFCWRI